MLHRDRPDLRLNNSDEIANQMIDEIVGGDDWKRTALLANLHPDRFVENFIFTGYCPEDLIAKEDKIEQELAFMRIANNHPGLRFDLSKN